MIAHTKLLIRIRRGGVVGLIYGSLILLDGDLALAGAAGVVVVHGVAGGHVVILVVGRHVVDSAVWVWIGEEL